MDIMKAIKNRHSVRDYTDKKIENEILEGLKKEIKDCNMESGLHIQLVTDEPEAFNGIMASYGKFKNVKNYIALVGKKDAELDERIGYYGERVALKAQQLGLNSCWVALTFSKGKSKCVVENGEKLVCVLSFGYGQTQGIAHKSRSLQSRCKVDGNMPTWFKNGMESAMLAPTAMNQQKFLITLAGGKVNAKATGGFYSKVDLGIIKYHFEVGAGTENFRWE